MGWRQFEDLARKTMSQYFGVRLFEKNPRDFPKRFDMVSADESIIGDSKFLTLVKEKKYPPCQNDGDNWACLVVGKSKRKDSFLSIRKPARRP